MKTIILMIMFLFLTPLFSFVGVYAYFDTLNRQIDIESINIGEWEGSVSETFSNELVEKLVQYFGEENIEDLYNNDDFQTLQQGTYAREAGDIGDDVESKINNIKIGALTWDFEGFFEQARGNRSVGFIRIIDRFESEGNPIYQVSPPPTNDPDENFLNVYDIGNNLTNNRNSVRLENNAQITTTNRKFDFETISLYASIGLSEEDADRISDQPRNLTISISEDNVNFEEIKTHSVSVPSEQEFSGSSLNRDFDKIEINLDSSQVENAIQNGYYIRIEFDGSWEGGGGNAVRSRVILDKIEIK